MHTLLIILSLTLITPKELLYTLRLKVYERLIGAYALSDSTGTVYERTQTQAWPLSVTDQVE